MADGALAVVVALVTVVAVVVESRTDDEQLTAMGIVLLAGQFVLLPWRRRFPLAVAAIVGLCALAYGMSSLPDPPVMFAPLLAIYTVAASEPRSITVPFAGVVVAAAAVGIVLGDESDLADVTTAYFSVVTAWVVGDTARGQRERATWLAARQADEARRAARDERERITRELHDVVAHHVSVIAVQAEAAQEVLATQPDRAGEAMGHIADTARTALGELRRVFGVLRADSDADLSPQPDLTTVHELVASMHGTGVEVTLHTSGDDRPVDKVVGLTAYRVVQEALTNVLKHAGRCRAMVGLEFDDDALVVTVDDDGAAAPASADEAGQGLVGMRERVAVLGGTFEAGPRDDGAGFAVRARLPLVT